MTDTWEVKYNGTCFGKYSGHNAEKLAKDNFKSRLEPRPKNTYTFELYRNNVKVDSQTSSVKGSNLVIGK